jgi:DNA replication licensing factor MCM2
MSDVCSDYDSNAALDTYSVGDIDDRSSLDELDQAGVREVNRLLDRRDRGLPGGRASRRSRAPAFLQSDDDDGADAGDGLLSGINTRRRRRQYDERMDEDDVDEEDVRSMQYRADSRKSRWNISATSRLPLSLNGSRSISFAELFLSTLGVSS